MPFVLRKAPNRDLYWVVNRDTKKKHSKEPLPKERAEAQMKALYAAENDMTGAGKTYREKFYEAYKVEPKSYSLDELSKISKVPKSTLQEVYNRGIGAYKTQPKSVRLQHSFVKNVDAPMSAKLSKEMWAMARVYSFLMGNPKHDNDLRANRGGQITDEQIEKYAPTIQAALPEFQAGPEPTHGAYERYKKGVEKARARGMTTPLMSYDEWANQQRSRDEGRQFAVEATKKKVISELPNLIKGYEELEADPIVACPYDAKGTVRKTSMRKSECKAARDAWEKINHPENYYFFRPAVEGLVKVGDFAAENILPLVPGIGKVVGEAYKQFAPPESQFYEDSLGKMISGRGKVHYVARRVGGRRIKGKGWFSSAIQSVKRAATSAYERAAAVFKGPRQDFPPSVRRTLAQVGSLPVVEMVIRRDPIQSLLNKALNVISLGSWDRLRKEYNYDELFHLGVEVTVRLSESNNYTRRYVIEKNEVINVSPAKAYTDKTQTWRVPMAGSTTIDTLLANTKLIMGANFFPYDPFKNNCQDFIWSLLTANGYATPELKAVVKQPMEDLVSKLPGFTGKIAKAVTDVGAIANVALEGQGTRGGMRRQAVDVPAAAARLQREINLIPEYQRDVERRRNIVTLLGSLGGLLPAAIGTYLGTENIPATIGVSTVATFASMLGSLVVDERRRRRQEQRRNEAAIRDYMNSLETTPVATEPEVAYFDPDNPSYIYLVPRQPPAEAVAESTEHVAIPVSDPTEPGTFTVENPMRRGRGKCTSPPGRKTPFQLQLKTAGVCPQKYLELARRVAKKAGYNPEDVEFSDNLDKKLMTYNQAGRRVHFGAVGSGDFLLHSLEGNKKLAEEKRDSYLARALKIKGKWRDDRYSPNMLAIQILWDKKR